ncbi:DUF3963 domain-containing protein (plasmid) [Arthrobacter citreus]|nr:DUF3963 domain-containing protein [Arthrobacter citreus]
MISIGRYKHDLNKWVENITCR